MIYHSQPATQQDRWVIEDSNGLRGGYFVEIGAYDGVTHSNTLTLEREFGWKGTLVEANPILFPSVQLLRPLCRCLNVAVGPWSSQGRGFYMNEQWGGLVDWMPEDWLEEARKRKAQRTSVPMQTLAEMLEGVPHVDYLSLDIEGAEIAVLKAYFEHPNTIIDRITVEYREETKTLAELCWILERDYELVRVQAWDAFFKRKELCK
jgi:FkbM family methyltransferase